ncbi:MAG: arylamine N-acetyltransferase [Gammaproteobacteria bacterium]
MLDLDAYFRRIAYRGERAPTLSTLRALQAQHLLAVAFENLDTLAGRTVRLDAESLQHKLVAAGRGGYCFEHNLLFSHVLRMLGFTVTALAARVVWERPADMLRARTHMLLLADLDGERYLCDVGFGGLTPTAPLCLVPGAEQATSHETFRVLHEPPEFVVQARVGGEWKPLYRFDLQPQQQVDIEVLNFYVAEHEDSPMRGRLVAARVAPDRRFALRDGTFSVYYADGQREQRELVTLHELRDVLGDIFGIAVPTDAGLDAALRALLP